MERTATDTAQLLEALALPSQKITSWGNTACPAIGWIAPWLFLVDTQGRWIHPDMPLTGCHLPRPELEAALEGLQQTTRDLRTLQITRSPEAARAGCEQQWKNMIVETLDQPGSAAEPAAITEDPFAGRPVRRCIYEFSGQPGDPGSFVRGGPLSKAGQQSLVGSTSATAPCSQSSAEFAVLRRIDEAGPIAYVELGGCRRILVSADSDTLAQATSDVVERLG